jgi:hypothetical protein
MFSKMPPAIIKGSMAKLTNHIANKTEIMGALVSVATTGVDLKPLSRACASAGFALDLAISMVPLQNRRTPVAVVVSGVGLGAGLIPCGVRRWVVLRTSLNQTSRKK